MTTLKSFGTHDRAAMRISLGSINPDVAAALADAFHDVAAVEVVSGDLLHLNCDAIVSPANSFGDMGGGIDKAIDDFHAGEAQRRVIAAIAERYFGELPVGAALIVELSAQRFPFVIAAPTMRTPGNVSGSINAYLAMRAALVEVIKHNSSDRKPISSIAIPGLGTGIGGMDSCEAATQMRAAYDNIVGGQWRDIVYSLQAPFALRSH